MTPTPEAAPKRRQPKPETVSADAVPYVVETATEETSPPVGHRYIAVRRMTYQGQVLQAGDPVPGAEDWPRVDAWVRARYLKEV